MEKDEEWEREIERMPESLRDIGRRFPATTCYRAKDRPDGHYIIVAYDLDMQRKPVVRVVHGADSYSPGIAVFGFDPETLTPCSCGKWEGPTDDQRVEMHHRINVERVLRGLPPIAPKGPGCLCALCEQAQLAPPEGCSCVMCAGKRESEKLH